MNYPYDFQIMYSKRIVVTSDTLLTWLIFSCRWLPANLRDSRYVWLPLTMDGPFAPGSSSGLKLQRVSIHWADKWKLPQGWKTSRPWAPSCRRLIRLEKLHRLAPIVMALLTLFCVSSLLLKNWKKSREWISCAFTWEELASDLMAMQASLLNFDMELHRIATCLQTRSLQSLVCSWKPISRLT